MDINYEHSYTVPYEFDPNDINETARREIIQRHYDFTKWCEEHADSPFHIDKTYNSNGITVSFESEEEFQEFIDFTANYYWIFLHN